MAFKADSYKKDIVTVLKLSGTLDSASKDGLRKAFDGVLAKEKYPMIVLDLSALEYLSSLGWGLFVEYNRIAKENGGGIKLALMNDRIDRLYVLMGIAAQIESFRDLDGACSSFILK